MLRLVRSGSARRLLLPVVVAISLAGLVVGGAVWIDGASAASLAAAEATGAALTALEEEFLLLGAEDEAALDRSFAGSARDAQRDLRAHVRGLIAQGTDYPGRRTLSDVEILSISVRDTDTAVIEFTAHVRLANMKAGKTVDFLGSRRILPRRHGERRGRVEGG